MKKLIIITSLLCCLIIIARGQDASQNLSTAEAGKLLHNLSLQQSDTSKSVLFIKSALYQIFKPGENKADLDSAALFLNKAEMLNAKAHSEYVKGYLLFARSNFKREQGDRDAGLKFATAAVNTIKTLNDHYLTGQAYIELSQYGDGSSENDLLEKIRTSDLAVNALRLSGNTMFTAYALKHLADLYFSHSELGKSIVTLRASLKAYQSINYKDLGSVYSLFSSLYYALYDYRKAFDYSLLALKIAEEKGADTPEQSQINNSLGVILTQLNEFEKALEYQKKAIQIAQHFNNNLGVQIILLNMVNCYNKLNRPADALRFIKTIPPALLEAKTENTFYLTPASYLNIYTGLKDFNRGQTYCNQLLEILKVHKTGDVHLYNATKSLLIFYISSKQYPSAVKYIAKMDSVTKVLNEPLKKRDKLFLQIRLDTTFHQYKTATHDLLIFKELNDSLINETKSRQFKELEIEYESEKKESEIRAKDQNINILNQKTQLQQANLQKSNQIRNITLAAVALLVIITGLLYRQYRHKQESNQVITHKNELLQRLLHEKEWLLKEVHHRVKNNLHTVICLLESQATYLENDALKAIENSQHRIYAMSLIHQKLYQSEDIKSIDMSTYLPELVEYLKDSFGTGQSIRFGLAIDRVLLEVSQAIPLALIINEAVTNAIKYAFGKSGKGNITIEMHQTDQQVTLTIQDDGVGISSEILGGTAESLGIKLMKGLSDDINAALEITNMNGTKVSVTFRLDRFGHAYDEPLMKANQLL